MTITGMEHGGQIGITGTISGQTSLSGSYTNQHSNWCTPSTTDVGTISATLIPSVQSTAWTGTTHSTQNPPGDTAFVLNLAEDISGGNISGVLTFTGSSGSSSSCPLFGGTISVGGQQTGLQVSLFDNKLLGLSIEGTTDSVAKNFSGGYNVKCGCNSVGACDFGLYTMSRP